MIKKETETRKKEIFTIDAYAVLEEYSLDDMRYAVEYEDYDSALNDAIKYAGELKDDDRVVNITVFGGEYKYESGDVYGEPIDIVTISNKDYNTTADARKQAGYVRLDVDVYIEPNGQVSL